GSLGSAQSAAKLPPYVERSLLFPYLGGLQFVQALREGTGDWQLVNIALRYRPPASTTQVLHPSAWLNVVQPQRVALPVGPLLKGAGYRRVGAGVQGEFDTAQILRSAVGDARSRAAAAGWAGARYE